MVKVNLTSARAAWLRAWILGTTTKTQDAYSKRESLETYHQHTAGVCNLLVCPRAAVRAFLGAR